MQNSNLIKLPSFIIAGVPKSGTTSISRFLSKHPDIYIPEKELNYYAFHGLNTDFQGIQIDTPTDIETYSSYFQVSNENMITGEKSSSYMYSEWYDRIIKNIKEHHPDAENLKIIIILRQPVERMFSQYIFNLNYDESIPFEKAIFAWPVRKKNNWIPAYDYFGMSFYSKAVRAYLDNFKQVGIFFYDELKNDFLHFINEISGFLEIDPNLFPNIHELKYNEGKVSQGRFGKMSRTMSQIGRIKALLENAFGNRDKSSVRSFAYQRTHLKYSVKKELTRVFREDILNLQEIVKRDLSHWL